MKRKRNDSGQALVEYVLIATMTVVTAVGVMKLIGADVGFVNQVAALFEGKLNLFSFVLSLPY